jgi:ubiquinol-cytochrome c reductase cytochrome c subunit
MPDLRNLLTCHWCIPALLLLLGAPGGFCQRPDTSASPAAEIYRAHCAPCHGEKGEGVSAFISIAGPPLLAVHDPGTVMTAVEVGPGRMPSFARALSVEQIHAVANYVTQELAVIPLDGGDLAEGGKIFRRYCAPCHRTAVRGGALAFAGANAPELTGMSAAIVAGTIRRGAGPMPSFPATVLDEKQLASVVRYVRFVQHPPKPGGNALNWYGPVAEGLVAWVAMFGLIGIVGWIEKGGKG